MIYNENYRTNFTNTAIMALLYNKIANDADIVTEEQVDNYQRVINENLNLMNSECGFSERSSCEDDPQKFYFWVTDSNKKDYFVRYPEAELAKNYRLHVAYLHPDIIEASLMENALMEIGVSKKILEEALGKNTWFQRKKQK